MELKATVHVPVNPPISAISPVPAADGGPLFGCKTGILTLDIPTLTDGRIGESFTDNTPMTEIWDTTILVTAFNKAAEAFNERLHQELHR